MGWYLRKSVRVGPMRFNFSKRGVGVSAGIKGVRVGTGPRGPYVAGGRGGLYFRQSLASSKNRGKSSRTVNLSIAEPVAGASGGQASGLGSAVVQSAAVPASRHLYSKRSLIGMWAASVASALFILGDPLVYATNAQMGFSGSLGIIICLCVAVYVCVSDWRGATSLNGFIKWGRLRGWQRFLVGYFMLGLIPFLLVVYLIQASQTYRGAQQAAPLERQRQVAELEAALGIMPATSGICRQCGKPLQVGAEYCAYCGASVMEKPQICPNCATTTAPDAKFCPKCRTALHPD